MYNWAVNKNKLTRAVKFVNDQVTFGKMPAVTEEAIKTRYIDLGGLVLTQEEIEIAEEDAAETIPAELKTVRGRGRRVNN